MNKTTINAIAKEVITLHETKEANQELLKQHAKDIEALDKECNELYNAYRAKNKQREEVQDALRSLREIIVKDKDALERAADVLRQANGGSAVVETKTHIISTDIGVESRAKVTKVIAR